jgi:Tol biopolymer transport system component
MDADGTNQKRLTNSKMVEVDPKWPSDGSEIVFLALDNIAKIEEIEIYKSNIISGSYKNVTGNNSYESNINWYN